MKAADGATQPGWYTGVKIPQYASLRKAAEVDVCIVGAGIAGLTAAYLLAKEGQSVLVLDEGEIGGGQTGRTSGHLTAVLDTRFVESERRYGLDRAQLAMQSHRDAIDTIEGIVREEKIHCDFARIDGILTPTRKDPPDLLDRELAAAERENVPDVQVLNRHGSAEGRCLRIGGQARFHPLRYLIGLSETVKRLGGRIHTGRRVMDVQGIDAKTKKPGRVELKGGAHVTAQHIVVATNTPSPINDWFGIYTKQSSYRSYVIGSAIPRKAFPDVLMWDTADPYHFIRLQPMSRNKNDLLIIGGEDHKTGQMPKGDPFASLETWARLAIPALGSIRYRWSGQVQESADGLAFIGRAVTDTQEVFVATGDCGQGLTYGTIAGRLLTDLILGRSNPCESLYDPSRKILNLQFASENANTLAQYRDFLTGGDVSAVSEIQPGQGAVVREGLKKLAIYRDPQGKLHRHSAVCTHLQCIVHWNTIEQSWDCPCHGSRFDPMGKVLMGPAIDDLPSA